MLKDETGFKHLDHNATPAILYKAFKERLGTKIKTQNPLLIQHLLHPIDNLCELEVPSEVNMP